MKIWPLLFILFFSSCSFIQTSQLSHNILKDVQKVCLSAEGRGRLILQDKKYTFSYESALRQEEKKWFMSFVFPIYGEEYVELEWTRDKKVQYQFSFEQKLLKEQKGLSPEELEIFFETWTKFLHEIIQLKNNRLEKMNFLWISSDKTLIARQLLKDYQANVQIEFKNLVSDSYFGRYDIIMQHSNSLEKFRIEVIVRKCLEIVD